MTAAVEPAAAFFTSHANDPRIPEVVEDMAKELGAGNKKPEVLSKLAQYELTLLDINNTVPKDMYKEAIEGKFDYSLTDNFMGFHCGNTCSTKLAFHEMRNQKIMARSLPEGVPNGTLEGDIIPGKITFYRLQSTVDCRLRAYVAEGEVLPVATKSFGHFGKALFEVFKYLGVPRSVIVAAGTGDNAAAAVGTGTVGPGRCNLSLGTSGTIFLTNNRYLADPRGVMHSFAYADGGYHLMGERSPHNDAAARAAFIGMSMDTSRADMLQAVFEGVAFGLRDSLESARKMGIHPMRATICGGAKSPLWRKIIANIMNINVDVPAVEEGPGYGAASKLSGPVRDLYPDVSGTEGYLQSLVIIVHKRIPFFP